MSIRKPSLTNYLESLCLIARTISATCSFVRSAILKCSSLKCDDVQVAKRISQVRLDTMNPNAPEHQPGVATDEEIMAAYADKLFSDPEVETVLRINKSTLKPQEHHVFPIPNARQESMP